MKFRWPWTPLQEELASLREIVRTLQGDLAVSSEERKSALTGVTYTPQDMWGIMSEGRLERDPDIREAPKPKKKTLRGLVHGPPTGRPTKKERRLALPGDVVLLSSRRRRPF